VWHWVSHSTVQSLHRQSACSTCLLASTDSRQSCFLCVMPQPVGTIGKCLAEAQGSAPRVECNCCEPTTVVNRPAARKVGGQQAECTGSGKCCGVIRPPLPASRLPCPASSSYAIKALCCVHCASVAHSALPDCAVATGHAPVV
jgi:hypothetical protein